VFKQLKEEDQNRWREIALEMISNECKDHQRTGVVSGHRLFWSPDKDPKWKSASIKKNWEAYTHIIYLNTDPDLVAHRARSDTQRARREYVVDEPREWQKTERQSLRNTGTAQNCCREVRAPQLRSRAVGSLIWMINMY
jgi:adenylate kinase